MTTQPTEIQDFFTPEERLKVRMAQSLTALDRCDSCSAQAYILAAVTGTDSTLMFCGHHWRAVEGSGKLSKLIDQTAKLLERPTAALTEA